MGQRGISRISLDRPGNRHVAAYVPDILRFHTHEPLDTSLYDTNKRGLETAYEKASGGGLCLLRGHYRALLNACGRAADKPIERLRTLRKAPKGVALLCSGDEVLDLGGSPVIDGIRELVPIPSEWYQQNYVLPLASFADLRIRRNCEDLGLALEGLDKPLIVPFGVFLPDRKLVKAFHNLIRRLRAEGTNDFQDKIVCDTFSGSGVFGFLAAHYKARWVHFVDIDPKAIEAISLNAVVSGYKSGRISWLGSEGSSSMESVA